LQHSPEGWSRQEVPDDVREAHLYGVWGMDDGTAVAVGGGLPRATDTAVILHFHPDSGWTRADASSIKTRTLRAVWGSAPDDYFAVGDDGAIAHFDGDRWTPSPSKIDDRLRGVYGSGPRDVYAVGGVGRGLILRYNGSSWLPFDYNYGEALNSAWTAPGHPLFVGGDLGVVARYQRDGDIADRRTRVQATVSGELRVQSLLGLGSAVLGSASTMETGEDGDWRGAVVAHGRSFGGPVFDNWLVDAGVPDATPTDASSGDDGAVTADAAIIDATP
jgi:hypothetical protein